MYKQQYQLLVFSAHLIGPSTCYPNKASPLFSLCPSAPLQFFLPVLMITFLMLQLVSLHTSVSMSFVRHSRHPINLLNCVEAPLKIVEAALAENRKNFTGTFLHCLHTDCQKKKKHLTRNCVIYEEYLCSVSHLYGLS